MLILHRSGRADHLVAALGGLLADPLSDPVTPEIVAVPTRGVERWITQCLSHRLGTGASGDGGVCANLEFPFPGTLVTRATAQSTGIDPARDPWAPERLVWPLVEVLDARRYDPVLEPLVQHLVAVTPPARGGDGSDRDGPGGAGPGSGRLRRFATARHLAGLFDHYAIHRPDLVQAWAAGDGRPVEVAAGAEWQPHLWRLVRHAVDCPSPAERLPEAVDRIRASPGVLDLPDRLSVFGLTRLPAGQLAVLEAIAAGRDVHLFLLHPSGALWDRVARELPVLLSGLPPGRSIARGQDPTARSPQHPLLRSWGRDAREMQLVLGRAAADDRRYYPVEQQGATLLGRVQADIRDDRPPGVDRPVIGATDRSIQVHACHGRIRQVEVLRDALLHLLEDDPSLEPRDVIVMCPDIETYAPLVQAVFGVESGTLDRSTDEPVLRVRLADRSLRQTNPLLGVAAELLELAGSRVTAPAVVDLLSRAPVARRFRFDQDDLATIEQWVAGTAVRWGLDADHRRPWSLHRLDANTWSAGLDRLLLGVAMAEEGCRTFEGTVPYDEMTSTQVDLAGRLAEFVDRLRLALDRLSPAQPVSSWVDALVDATDSLACSPPDEAWQQDEMRALLEEVAAGMPSGRGGPGRAGRSGGAAAAGSGPDLALEEVQVLLADQLRGRPTRANFRTGDLTICTLVPMRSVPHRVVALLGLDDGAFPRHPETDGDDLLLAEPRVGDRDARSEDRQLLLDALLAATDYFVLTYCGHDERTNRPRPPCAPVAELLDVIGATARTSDGAPVQDAVVVHHPLQPFDPRNFRAGELVPGRSWSFDRVFLAGARAAVTPDVLASTPIGLLPPLDEPVVRLEDLVAFVQHPARAFLRKRLSLYLGDWTEELDDRMPLELDPLERWGLGDRLLEAVMGGIDLEQAAVAEVGRGMLPPGALAGRVLGDVANQVAGLAAALSQRGFAPGPSQAEQVQIDLPDGRALFGMVPQVREHTILQCVFSKLGPKHRLASWVRFLALSADRPDQPVSAVTIGRAERRGAVAVSTFPPLPGSARDRRQQALDRLLEVVDLYDRGMRCPLPMACGASAQWAEGSRRGLDQDEVVARVSSQWNPSGDIPGERDQAEHVHLYGRYSDFRVLLREPSAPGESGPGWHTEEPHRFGRLARRLWYPLLDHETSAVQ